MKEVYRNDDVIAYDGFKDAFGGKYLLLLMKLCMNYVSMESIRILRKDVSH